MPRCSIAEYTRTGRHAGDTRHSMSKELVKALMKNPHEKLAELTTSLQVGLENLAVAQAAVTLRLMEGSGTVLKVGDVLPLAQSLLRKGADRMQGALRQPPQERLHTASLN